MKGREEEGEREQKRDETPGAGELWVTVPGVGGGASHPRLSPCTPRPRRRVSQ